MNVLKNPSFFRPASRPTSPSPIVQPRVDTPNVTSERPSRPHNKLSLSSLMRQPSQSPGPSYSPAVLVQDGSYLEMLSLKLGEAVSKALAQPAGVPPAADIPAGKRPIPQGRGLVLGSLIASELKAAHDPHLHRAVLRTLQRPLTVLLTNLSAQLLPSLSSPLFQTIPTASNGNVPFPNAVQQHALSIAKFAEELLHSFDQSGLGLDSDARGDGLKPIRDGLNSLITRITNPLVANIRNELIPLVEGLESAPPANQSRPSTGAKATTIYHPSIVALNTLVPIYARALSSFTTSVLSHATLANLLISVLWKALVALSHRVDAKPSPLLIPQASPLLTTKKRRTSPSASTTPPITPPASRFMLKLPPSRPPSPPAGPIPAKASTDCKALYDLLVLFPRPSAEHESTRLAREAVDEAFEGLRTLPFLLLAANNATAGQSEVPDARSLVRELNSITTEIPTLIALPVLLHAFGGPGNSSVASLLSLSEEEYRKGCLSGFARAEECTVAVVKKVISMLQVDRKANEVLLRWLEMELIEIEGTA